MHNILYIHHAGELGGAPKSLSVVLKGLDQEKFKAYVFMLIDGEAKKLFKIKGVEIITSKIRLYPFHGTTVSGMNLRTFLTNIIFTLPNIVSAIKIIKKVKPDIIHLNTTCLFVYAIVAKIFFRKIKIISHVREPLLDNIHGNVLKYFNKKFVDYFIPINYFESSFFLNKPLKIIKNSVDLTQYKSNPEVRSLERKKLNLCRDVFVIGFFARFNIENGIEDLLKISIELEKIDKQIILLIYGYEPRFIDEASRNIAKNMPSNVILKGMVKDIHFKMQATDIVISPFKTPHFSRSVIEAQSLSIPVIVSNVKSQNTLLINSETGFLYDFGHVQEVIDKILLLKNNSNLYKLMKTNAREYALNNFCEKKNNKEVFSIYFNLINQIYG